MNLKNKKHCIEGWYDFLAGKGKIALDIACFITDTIKHRSSMIKVLKRYELWEAHMLSESKCWENEYPQLTEELYDELLEIQELRNEAMSTNQKQQKKLNGF